MDATKNAEIHPNRETYLLAAVELLKPMFIGVGAALPPVHVATGWPSSRGLSAKRKALGEAWDKACSADGQAQIFISPWIGDALDLDTGTKDGMGVLPTLVHELVHAAVGNKAGHGAPFKRVAVALGLDGKMTATNAGPELRERLEALLPALGKYPHAKIEPALSGKKKQGTRMVKCTCETDDCGYTVRTTKKWLDLATPICPVHHTKMTFEPPAEEGDGEDGDNE